MRRYVVWLISAAIAMAVYAVANQAGLSNTVVLILTFVGAMAGAVLGNVILQGRQTRD
jgi:phosphoserine phosphatase